MSPRRRRKAIPVPNLYERRGYFSWRNPQTRQEFGLGKDKARAIAEAIEANLHILGSKGTPRLVERLTGDATRTVEAWNVKYQALLDKQKYASGTRATYKSWGKRMVNGLGAGKTLQSVTALDVSTLVEAIVSEGKNRTAQVVRKFIQDSFTEAKSQGWYIGDNPVQETKFGPKAEVQRARFTWETFQTVYAKIPPGWLRNAVDLALVSGQRREDVALAQFRDFHDGGWWLVQQSEKGEIPHRIFIPLDLRLNCLGKSLADVIGQCRRSGVISRNLIHHMSQKGRTSPGSPVRLEKVTEKFTDAVTASGLSWEPKTPPTFHELRSLSERLYKSQGGINTQQLLGHTNPETTALYDDSRGAEVQWVHIEIGGGQSPPRPVEK